MSILSNDIYIINTNWLSLLLLASLAPFSEPVVYFLVLVTNKARLLDIIIIVHLYDRHKHALTQSHDKWHISLYICYERISRYVSIKKMKLAALFMAELWLAKEWLPGNYRCVSICNCRDMRVWLKQFNPSLFTSVCLSSLTTVYIGPC